MTTAANFKSAMKKCQLLPSDIRQVRVLEAFDAVDRAEYVPQKFSGSAYVDEDIPLGGGRFLMAPVAFARLLEFALVSPEDKVLDIGCGMGYSSAVLAQMAHRVVALESDAVLSAKARPLLGLYRHVEITSAPLALGYAVAAPYSLIFLQGAVSAVPQALLEQLDENGGRLVAVQMVDKRPDSASGLGKALKITRRGKQFETFRDFDISVPMLGGFGAAEGFVF